MFDFASFLPRAVMQGIPLLYGSTGEILTEKSGNLNLGIPGVMYVGGICGVIGAFFYEQAVPAAEMSALAAIGIPMLCSLAGSLLMGLIYCLLTVTLRASATFSAALSSSSPAVRSRPSRCLQRAPISVSRYPSPRRPAGLVRSSCPMASWLILRSSLRFSLPTSSSTRAPVFICAPSARAPRLRTQPASMSRSISTSQPASAA